MSPEQPVTVNPASISMPSGPPSPPRPGDRTADAAAPAPAPALAALPWWRRFDVRLAAVFGGASLVIVGIAACFAYALIVEARMESFRQRLGSLAIALSQTVETDAIPGLERRADDGAAWRELWHEKLLTIVRSEPDIDSIYILLPTEKPAQLRFLLDASKVSRVADAGERYDATDYPYMLRAFQLDEVSVEDRVYADEFGATQSAYAPLRTSKGQVVGIIGVDVLAVSITETRRQVLLLCLALFCFTAVAIVAISFLLRRLVRRPIARMLATTEAIAAGRYDVRSGLHGRDEFGLLGNRIDAMAGQLAERERLRATFGLYVSGDLARTLLDSGKLPELGGVECLASVMFCELAHYGRVSECFSPGETVSLVNEYLGAMTEVIESHGGCVLDFNGDGIMAVFGAPVAHFNHADRALRAAIRMQQRMNQLNGEWEARDLALRWQKAGVEQLILRVGLHTGPVIAGHIGNSSRMRYSVMGETVNVAARIGEMNKELGTRIAFSDEVRQRVSADLVADFVDCDLRSIRGRQALVRIFAQ